MKRILWGISLLFLMAGCTLFDAPEGTVEVELGSVHTRIEQPTATEEIVYCSADLKITNTGNKTIYNCTVSVTAKSDKDIEHFISLSYDVNIPPSQSVYVTAEWSLIRKVSTKTTTSTSGSSTSSTSNTTSTTTTSTLNEETEWKKDSIKIVSYFFN